MSKTTFEIGEKVIIPIFNRPEFRNGEVVARHGDQYKVRRQDGREVDLEFKELEPAEPAPSPYPEHDKLHAVADRSQVISAFLNWMRTERQPAVVMYAHSRASGEHVPVGLSLLAEYFEIDLAKLEEEKLAMLEEQRALNRRDLNRSES